MWCRHGGVSDWITLMVLECGASGVKAKYQESGKEIQQEGCGLCWMVLKSGEKF